MKEIFWELDSNTSFFPFSKRGREPRCEERGRGRNLRPGEGKARLGSQHRDGHIGWLRRDRRETAIDRAHKLSGCLCERCSWSTRRLEKSASPSSEWEAVATARQRRIYSRRIKREFAFRARTELLKQPATFAAEIILRCCLNVTIFQLNVVP